MPLIKKRQLENWSQLNGDERERFIENLPAGREKLENLFDYLDVRLSKNDCEHDLKFTMQFLMENRLDMPKFMSWLNENGAYCDCEILNNVEPQWFNVLDEKQAENSKADESE